MGARINNFPAYVVYDRSFNGTATASTIGSGSAITESNLNLWRDSNLSTAYIITNLSTTLGVDGQIVLYDFGSIFTNIQLSYKVGYNSGAFNAQYILETSLDNATWTTLETGATGGASIVITKSITLIQSRYVRTQLYLGGHINTPFETDMYELRLMGSG